MIESRCGVVVQARMGSSRLPGKVLEEVAGSPLLDHLFRRLGRARKAGWRILATTSRSRDDVLAKWAESSRVDLHRGPEDDVLARYAGAAEVFDLDLIVRVTSDCPLIDPATVDALIELQEAESADYAVTSGYPNGMGCEIMTRSALLRAHREARDPWEREHVTPYLQQPAHDFRIARLSSAQPLGGRRWTVDTPEDLELVSRILTALLPENPDFTLQDILALLDRHPDWERLNAHVRQKTRPHAATEPTSCPDFGFRVDANREIGFGHLRRCLNLARYLDDGKSMAFYLPREDRAGLDLVRSEGLAAHGVDRDAQPRARQAVIFDVSHDADPGHHRRWRRACEDVRRSGAACVVLDALGEQALASGPHFPADLVVVPYCGVTRPAGEGAPWILAGPEYFIAPASGSAATEPRSTAQRARRLLVTFGGTDPYDLTLLALDALGDLPDPGFDLRIVLGPGFAARSVAAIREQAAALSPPPTLLESPENLLPHMVWAELALSATGLTKYELALTGTPSIQVSIDEDHHRHNAAFARHGTALYLGTRAGVSRTRLARTIRDLACDRRRREKMSRRGRSLIDGQGGRRVAAAIERLCAR